MTLDIIGASLFFIILIATIIWNKLYLYVGGHDLELDGINSSKAENKQKSNSKHDLLEDRMPKNNAKINKNTTLYNTNRPQKKVDYYKSPKAVRKYTKYQNS